MAVVLGPFSGLYYWPFHCISIGNRFPVDSLCPTLNFAVKRIWQIVVVVHYGILADTSNLIKSDGFPLSLPVPWTIYSPSQDKVKCPGRTEGVNISLMILKVQKVWHSQYESRVGTKGRVTAQTCPNYAQTESQPLRGNDMEPEQTENRLFLLEFRVDFVRWYLCQWGETDLLVLVAVPGDQEV